MYAPVRFNCPQLLLKNHLELNDPDDDIVVSNEETKANVVITERLNRKQLRIDWRHVKACSRSFV
jgi:hypothetical protein